MERLTQTSKSGGLAFTFDLDVTCERSEMINIMKLGERLKEFEDIGLEPEEIIALKSLSSVDVGQTVYVVTQCGFRDYEVIECMIHKKTVKTRISFSAKGRYSNGNYYNGTFVEKSIGKTVFKTREEAIKCCDKLNMK